MSEIDFHQVATEWTHEPFDEVTRKEATELLKGDKRELEDRFYKDLEFGTGGMRGIMGVGTNRINKYTLGRNTKGLANYLKEQFPGEKLKVAIAYDCRHNSRDLAYTVAGILSAEGVEVYIFTDLRPTPLLSFTLTRKNCHAGIVLTASHNPPEYNGYKVYWQDGGQLVPPHDKNLMNSISQVHFGDIDFDRNDELIKELDRSDDEAFIDQSVKYGKVADAAVDRSKLKVVFTSLHGTSITMIPDVLEEAGYTDVHIVKDQAKPNGDFPTVESPNPEEPEALALAIQLANKLHADIVIGTDPDSDRLGIAVRNPAGELTILNGNQTMILLTDFLLSRTDLASLNKPFIGSTIVSTPMMQKLADAYGVELKEGLTGFKWIAKMIKDNPEQDFIGGGEESFGYMVSDFVRDKDAVTAALLACEVCAQAKHEKSSTYEELLKLYVKHGLYKEKLVSLVKKGKTGAEEIKAMLDKLRSKSPERIAGIQVTAREDYLNGMRYDVLNGSTSEIDLPQSNVLVFYLEDGSKIAARPSGTEPKIKFYVSVKAEIDSTAEFSEQDDKLDQHIHTILAELGVS